jgi:hypothetical protein
VTTMAGKGNRAQCPDCREEDDEPPTRVPDGKHPDPPAISFQCREETLPSKIIESKFADVPVSGTQRPPRGLHHRESQSVPPRRIPALSGFPARGLPVRAKPEPTAPGAGAAEEAEAARAV